MWFTKTQIISYNPKQTWIFFCFVAGKYNESKQQCRVEYNRKYEKQHDLPLSVKWGGQNEATIPLEKNWKSNASFDI